jgi:rhodanese-related sulfurtransferase
MPKTLKDFVDEALKTVPEVTPEEARKIQEEGEWLILDVREPEEYRAGHLEHSINIPRGFLEVKADLEHPKKDDRLANRSQKVLCYCGGGHRSALACKALQEMGFETVASMKEGWTGWTKREFPYATPYDP